MERSSTSVFCSKPGCPHGDCLVFCVPCPVLRPCGLLWASFARPHKAHISIVYSFQSWVSHMFALSEHGAHCWLFSANNVVSQEMWADLAALLFDASNNAPIVRIAGQ